jgi:hypothetical protein
VVSLFYTVEVRRPPRRNFTTTSGASGRIFSGAMSPRIRLWLVTKVQTDRVVSNYEYTCMTTDSARKYCTSWPSGTGFAHGTAGRWSRQGGVAQEETRPPNGTRLHQRLLPAELSLSRHQRAPRVLRSGSRSHRALAAKARTGAKRQLTVVLDQERS